VAGNSRQKEPEPGDDKTEGHDRDAGRTQASSVRSAAEVDAGVG